MTVAITLLCLPAALRAQLQTKQRQTTKPPKPCAYAAVNSNCTLQLDRLNPVAPPTIYVRRGSQVTVTVTHALPFEYMTIDKKSVVAQLASDQFRNGFPDITAALGGLGIISVGGGAAHAEVRTGGPGQPPPVCPDHMISEQEIESCQTKLKDYLTADMHLNLNKNASAPAPEASSAPQPPPNLNFGTWVYSRLCWSRTLFLPLQPSGVTPVSPVHVCEDLPDSARPPDISKAENDLTKWVKDFSEGGADQLKFPPNDVGKTIDLLDVDIADAKKTITPGEYVTMKAAQQALHGAFETAAAYQSKMQGLLNAVTALTLDNEPSEFEKTITDLDAKDADKKEEKNYETQTWDINVGNKLAWIAGQIKADKFGDQITGLMGNLANAPTNQTVVEFKIEFLNEPRLEISSGLLVPVRPYHSFSEATPYSSATSTSGSCAAGTTIAPSAPTNCPIVQQSLTLAVVPNVSFNIPIHEFILGQQPAAWFFTIAPGYNSATTSATIGGGISFSYRSMVFSFLPLADRDTQLTGGFQVNQSAGTATSPTTANYWRFNGSVGISLRIPLGGGGS